LTVKFFFVKGGGDAPETLVYISDRSRVQRKSTVEAIEIYRAAQCGEGADWTDIGKMDRVEKWIETRKKGAKKE